MRKITALMICILAGFIVMVIGICLNGDRSIPVVMSNMWVREFAALWMLVCVFFSLTVHRPSFSTRKTSSDHHTASKPAVEIDEVTPNMNLEVLRKELEAPESGNV